MELTTHARSRMVARLVAIILLSSVLACTIERHLRQGESKAT